MATVATLIDRALRLLGQVEAGSNASTDEYSDGLIALNAMVDSWRNERLMAYATRTETLSLTASTTSYTIGSGGNLNTTRPLAIEDAWIESSGVTYPCSMVTDAEYDAIPTKAETSDWPRLVNYRATMATGTLYVWPAANAVRTMKLRTVVPFTAFSATTDSVSLPPGWEEALAFNLAVEVAPEFQMEPSPTVIDRARQSKAAIKVSNSQPLMAFTDLAAMFPASRSNIITGE